MSCVTFIYRIHGNPKIFYGKCVFNRLSDDHEGLDREVVYHLLPAINKYRTNQGSKNLNKKNIFIGILACSSPDNYYDYSSKRESKCFDYYYTEDNYCNQSYFINGKQIDMK